MKNYVEKAMNFEQYIALIDDLLAENKTTGKNQSENYVYFGKLNRQRMKRLEKTIKLNESLVGKIKEVDKPLIWLTLTEGWCGDAAQNIPVIEKMAAENPLITTRYLLRDENLDLMNQYLTNGGKAIPILICIDGETFEVLDKWGSRPKAIQNYFLELKEAGIEKDERNELLQRRYNADEEQSIQADFAQNLVDWIKSTETIKVTTTAF
ncbi:MAG: thioredoxin family protein [Pyrinomonadaceae bacterium]|nr:thioredoxin family protein [Pyrinomonadaceae bacterium]